MKLKISVLTAASAVTLLLATLASLAKADTVSYPSRDAGFSTLVGMRLLNQAILHAMPIYLLSWVCAF
ncbi:hypothetical protein SAG0027_02110 [Streptococcus agalactiae FSL S3-251]|nr:hypothetical protein SAG0027_02110 [Streptococcus agalactiae FSL S3-251]